jgi:hypothetical protein
MTRQEYDSMSAFEQFMFDELPKIRRAIEALKDD